MERLAGGPSGPDARDLAARLRHVLWIGGGTGARKTSIATALAEERGLQPYYYDFHDARDHSERVDPVRHPAMHAFASMSMDERWVLRTPEQMARETINSSRERMEMAIEDLLARPAGVPIVAEGPGSTRSSSRRSSPSTSIDIDLSIDPEIFSAVTCTRLASASSSSTARAGTPRSGYRSGASHSR